MARDYWFAFGSRPAANTGLSPTFITFVNSSGTTLAPPTIAETYSGSGLYKVNYDATQTIAFVMDGATTGLADSIRYIMGVFDPNDQFGTTLLNVSDRTMSLIALGNTAIAIGITGNAIGIINGNGISDQGVTIVAMGDTLTSIGVNLSGIGSTASLFGDSVTQPGTLFGYLKRVVEFLEGDQTYAKATGVLTYEARGGNTLLATKTIADSTSTTTRS